MEMYPMQSNAHFFLFTSDSSSDESECIPVWTGVSFENNIE